MSQALVLLVFCGVLWVPAMALAVGYNPLAPGDAGFTKGGAAAGWTSFGGGVYGTAIYTYVSPSVRDNWGRWTFDLSKLSGAGNYTIDAYITPTNAGTQNAVYHISTSGGMRDRSVNQRGTSGWTSLGTYNLSQGSSWVELDDVTGETNYFNANSRIGFDAVRLTFVAPPPPPPVTPRPPVTSVKTRPVVSVPRIKGTAKRGRTITIYGTLSPRHAAGGKSVVLRIAYVKGRGWVTKDVAVPVVDSASGSSYSYRYKLPKKKRTWAFKAYAPADTEHLASTDNVKSLPSSRLVRVK